MKIKTTALLALIALIFVISCKKNSTKPLVPVKEGKVESAPPPPSGGLGPPSPTAIYNLSKINADDYGCPWGGNLRIYSVAMPVDGSGLPVKTITIGGQTWQAVEAAFSSVGYASVTNSVVVGGGAKITVTEEYCASRATNSTFCTEWKSATNTKRLVKILNPHGALYSTLALVPDVYFSDGETPVE